MAGQSRFFEVDERYAALAAAGEPLERILWLFSPVLGHSRMMWGRFVAHQDL
jgi:hypothetical protein